MPSKMTFADCEAPVHSGDAFDEFKLHSDKVLTDSGHRVQCPKCSKSVRYFCYNCLIVCLDERYPTAQAPKSGTVQDCGLPYVDLPFPITIVKHPVERNGKSTALHAPVIAPDKASVLAYSEDLAEFKNPDRLLLLYPSSVSRAMPMIFAK